MVIKSLQWIALGLGLSVQALWGGLAEDIAAVLQQEKLPANIQWGMQLVEANSGKVLYQIRAKENFVPASALKVITTAAVWDQLGPDFRFHSQCYYTGKVTTKGVLIKTSARLQNGKAGRFFHLSAWEIFIFSIAKGTQWL